MLPLGTVSCPLLLPTTVTASLPLEKDRLPLFEPPIYAVPEPLIEKLALLLPPTASPPPLSIFSLFPAVMLPYTVREAKDDAATPDEFSSNVAPLVRLP